MDSVDWAAGFEGVSLASIILGIVFLTVPGIGLAKGLAKYRKPAKGSGRPSLPRATGDNPRSGMRRRSAGAATAAAGQKKKRSWINIGATLVTVVALLLAGLGLIPLMKALYRAIDHKWEYGGALVALIALVLLFAKVLAMVHDLKDGHMDHPMLWLAPIPIVAMLVWGFPALRAEMADRAGQSIQAVLGGSGTSSDEGNGSKKTDKNAEKRDRRSDNRGDDKRAGSGER